MAFVVFYNPALLAANWKLPECAWFCAESTMGCRTIRQSVLGGLHKVLSTSSLFSILRLESQSRQLSHRVQASEFPSPRQSSPLLCTPRFHLPSFTQYLLSLPLQKPNQQLMAPSKRSWRNTQIRNRHPAKYEHSLDTTRRNNDANQRRTSQS